MQRRKELSRKKFFRLFSAWRLLALQESSSLIVRERAVAYLPTARSGVVRSLEVGQIRSIKVPVPKPPPQHIVMIARCLLARSSSLSALVTRPHPVAPSGWPSAIAPPFGFTRFISGSNVLAQLRTTEAKASLISNTSMSSILSPFFASSLRVAGIGPSSINTGSQPETEFTRLIRRHEQHGRGAVGNLR